MVIIASLDAKLPDYHHIELGQERVAILFAQCAVMRDVFFRAKLFLICEKCA
jgi:hypothetical protein